MGTPCASRRVLKYKVIELQINPGLRLQHSVERLRIGCKDNAWEGVECLTAQIRLCTACSSEYFY